jgi:hypothetical protein
MGKYYLPKLEHMGIPFIFEAFQSIPEKGGDFPMPDIKEIKLSKEESLLFIKYAKNRYARKVIEKHGELANLFCKNDINYLTSVTPLVRFRFAFNPEIAVYLDKEIQQILEYLFNETGKWKELGADLVAISGVDLRNPISNNLHRYSMVRLNTIIDKSL